MSDDIAGFNGGGLGSKGDLGRLEKIDFKKIKNPKFHHDIGMRALRERCIKERDFLANWATLNCKKIARGATLDFYRRESGKLDKDGKGVKVDRFSAIEAHTALHGGEDGFNGESFLNTLRVDEKAVRKLYFVPEYWQEPSIPPVEEERDDRLYHILVTVSSESAFMRALVAWYLYTSGYMKVLTDEQAEFWETDFQLFELAEPDDLHKVNCFVEHTHTHINDFYEARDRLRKIVSELYQTARQHAVTA